MQHHLLVASVLALSPCIASAQSAYTLPDGLTKTGGNYSSGNGVSYVFDRGAFHYQEVHSSWVGLPGKVLTKAGFRRAWNRATNTTAVARTADFTFTVGYGDRATFSSASFAGNFKTSTAVNVLPKTNLSMPSWTNKPTTAPAPFDVVVPFKTVFVYDGKQDFVWELNYENPSVTGTTYYYCDRQSGSTSASDTGTSIGTGCTATGRTSAHAFNSTLYNYGPNGTSYKMRMYLSATNNPSSQPVTVAIGLTNPDVQVPGWCTKLHTDALLFLPVGSSSSTGTLSSVYKDFPHTPGVIGIPLFCQAFAPDTSLPSGISLTNAESLTMPQDPTVLSWKYVYQLSTSSTLSGPFTAGSVITGWN